MADDVNPALRAEINAAIGVIDPQIEGLADLAGIQASTEFNTLIDQQLQAHRERHRLLEEVIRALDALVAAVEDLYDNGYPNVDRVPVDSVRFQELKKQRAEMEAAFALFEAEPTASQIKVEFGSPAAEAKRK